MYFKHLTFEDRVKIQFLLETSENPKLKDIADKISESRQRNDKKQVSIEAINHLLTPQILDKQSIEVALLGQESLLSSTSSIRRYCNDGLLSFRNIDLPRTVRFRVKKV